MPRHNRVDRNEVLPSLHPHWSGRDDLDADAVAADVAAGKERGLLRPPEKPFDPDPRLRRPADAGIEPQRPQPQLARRLDQWGVVAERERVLCVEPSVAEQRTVERGIELPVLQGAAKPERGQEHPLVAYLEAPRTRGPVRRRAPAR